MREKQWAVYKQILLLPVKTSPALIHNMISLLKHDLWDALNLLLCAPDKQRAFISSLIIMRVGAICGQGRKMKALGKETSFQKKYFSWISVYESIDLSVLSHDPFTRDISSQSFGSSTLGMDKGGNMISPAVCGRLIDFLMCLRIMNFHSGLRLSGSVFVLIAWMSSTFEHTVYCLVKNVPEWSESRTSPTVGH